VSWTSKVMMTRTRTNSCAATHMRNSATIFLASPLPPAEQVRTFLNCHKLFLNTVSISLRAKIKSAHEIHTALRVLCLLASWNVVLIAFGTHFVLPCLLLEAQFHGLNDIRPLVHPLTIFIDICFDLMIAVCSVVSLAREGKQDCTDIMRSIL
jgi:hypothetical protein